MNVYTTRRNFLRVGTQALAVVLAGMSDGPARADTYMNDEDTGFLVKTRNS